MKKALILFGLFLYMFAVQLFPQNHLTLEEYQTVSTANQDKSYAELTQQYPPGRTFVQFDPDPVFFRSVQYLDSVQVKYRLTEGELGLLQKNRFAVTERVRYASFDQALMDIYKKDLPVFITTDMVLHALHFSYAQVLEIVEYKLHADLDSLVHQLRLAYPLLLQRYQNRPELQRCLQDIDMYTAVAFRLLRETEPVPFWDLQVYDPLRSCVAADSLETGALIEAIYREQLATVSLFSFSPRAIDFSQFKPRGKYAYRENYFRTMMWFNTTSFLLLAPQADPISEDWQRSMQRMRIDALLLDELLDLAGQRARLESMDEVLTFLVGDCDNLDVKEWHQLKMQAGLDDPSVFLDESATASFLELLKNNPAYQQKILAIYFAADQPDPEIMGDMPIAFKFLGQRFVLDAFILSQVVYDKIRFEGESVWRPLPDPLDVLFSLGNNNTLWLLQGPLEQYHYSGQLASMRAMMESYSPAEWQSTFYNGWLDAICRLHKPLPSGSPEFMNTAAWQHEKMNTQLAAWAQLRHDNLLYAKQSNTADAACSFPHSYVEPYPDFYRQIAELAEIAKTRFLECGYAGFYDYFNNLSSVAKQLQSLAEKELTQQPFSESDRDYLKSMLYQSGDYMTEPFSGWYADLYYYLGDVSQFDGTDYLLADVHTQPTDQNGIPVGHVLHVGVGKIDLGFFIAPSPSFEYQPVLFVGPVMSYYEKLTSNFTRMTNEEWADLVRADQTPERPDWTNCYLANSSGQMRAKGREIPTVQNSGVGQNSASMPQIRLYDNYPNPFNPSTRIHYTLSETATARITVYNALGQRVRVLLNERQHAGEHVTIWDGCDDQGVAVGSGIYITVLQCGVFQQTRKMTLIR